MHGPTEFPWSTKQNFQIGIGQAVTLTVTPQLIRTASQLKNYTPERRECYFNAENPLKYFKVYTKENCELECLAEYSKMLCNCIPYWMPRQNDSKICGLENFECYTLAVYKHLGEALNDGTDDNYGEDPSLNTTEKNLNQGNASSASGLNTNEDLTQFQKYLATLDQRYLAFLLGRQTGAEDDDITKKYDNISVNLKCKCLPACNSINYMAEYRAANLYSSNIESLPLG